MQKNVNDNMCHDELIKCYQVEFQMEINESKVLAGDS